MRRSNFSRRRLLQAAGAGVATAVIGATGLRLARAALEPKKIMLGSDRHRYEWIANWAQLPAGMTFGNTHGCIVSDAQGRIYMNTDSDNAVMVFQPDGKLITTWGSNFKGGLHGMAMVKEGGKEQMWVTHHKRNEVVNVDLQGRVLRTLPFPEQAGVYQKPAEYRPTSVAVAANGNIYVGDGYGLSWIHQYNARGQYVRSWGGMGEEPGRFRTPHGVWVDTRRKPHVLVICDRENHRLQIFDLDGKLLDIVAGDLRLPCHVHQHGDDLVVADLQGRVTILDKNNKVITHLGDNADPSLRGANKVDKPKWKDGEFIAPHCAHWDAQGNLYVLDWNYLGRITKLRRV